MSQEKITIRTQDGNCPASVFTPTGTGPWPAVLFCMDGLGIRPALFDMAQRLADNGYVVLLPNPRGSSGRGTDFAHAASDFPNSQKYLAEDFAGVPENELRAILVDNCVRYFHLDR